MIKKSRKRIYSKFEIYAILFYATMIQLIPLVLVFTHIYDIESKLNIDKFLFWLTIVNFILTVIGTVYLLLNKDKLQRAVKANYMQEFYYLLILSVFSILGFVVFFDLLEGPRQYIAHILIFIVVGVGYILLFLGRKFFNFDYKKRK
jgi:hypothetical protein